MPIKDAELVRAKLWLARKIEGSLPDKIVLERTPETVKLIQERFLMAQKHAKIEIPAHLERPFFDELLDEILGFGPLEPLLQDDTVTEVMVNRADQVYVERKGKMALSDAQFLDNAHVEQVINKIIKPLGRFVNKDSPLVDARLPDGSRVNAVVSPCAIDGANITIRKFSKNPFTIKDLIGFGSIGEDMAQFLKAAVVSKLNIVVSGGTGSGKTTLLNVLSSFIPEGDRIVTIEDAAELSLLQPHVVRLETKKPSRVGDTEVSIRDLVINSLRMRPERIVVGECRGGEALDMLQAMNTGHDGSLTTIHANSPRDTISRLETLVLMAGMDLPLSVVRKQIAAAVDLIVQQTRLRDGSRKVTSITEVTGMEGEMVVMQEIFRFDETGVDGEKVLGEFAPGGGRPNCEPRLRQHGFTLPATMFISGASVRGRRR
ncbi:MAG: CpaF family protein [Ardenticatenaceae bacterium]|nr:CpaF family protein [Anaerolineales bacterium]MCB8923243.1 CpaF family protein [Ardenticatenaceae bacterium]MCB8992252.1 CpaF family protein [Ardenticatenaceae bacterium]MCB9004812.1 CpaF family protein [Ardenticatenaceae bacterium]